MTDNTHADNGQRADRKRAEHQAEIEKLRERNAQIRAAELARGDYALPQFRSMGEKATGMDL